MSHIPTDRITQAREVVAASPLVQTLIWIVVLKLGESLASWASGYDLSSDLGAAALYFAFVAQSKADALARDTHHGGNDD
jgi:hypothetical protein